MSVNYLDILILLPLALAGFKGFRKGLIKELSGIIALIAGLILSKMYAPTLHDWLHPLLNLDTEIVLGIAFVLIFVGVVIVVNFTGSKLTALIKMVALGMINRIAGMLFGILKALVIVCCAIYLLESFNLLDMILPVDIASESLLMPIIEQLINEVFPVIKKEAQPIMDHASEITV